MAKSRQIVRGEINVQVEVTDEMIKKNLVVAEGEVHSTVPVGDILPKVPNAQGKVKDLTERETKKSLGLK